MNMEYTLKIPGKKGDCVGHYKIEYLAARWLMLSAQAV